MSISAQRTELWRAQSAAPGSSPGSSTDLSKSLGVCLLESSSNTVVASVILRGLEASEELHRFGSRCERILKLSLSCACGQWKFQNAAASGPSGPGLALESLAFNLPTLSTFCSFRAF